MRDFSKQFFRNCPIRFRYGIISSVLIIPRRPKRCVFIRGFNLFNIAVAENDPACAAIITEYIKQYALEHHLPIEVCQFRNAGELLAGFRPAWTAVIMDAELPDMDGISAAGEVRSMDESVLLVLIGNNLEQAVQGYTVGALDFIIKPLTRQQVILKMDRIVSAAHTRRPHYVLLSVKSGMIRISTEEILYVEVTDHHLHIVMTDRDFIVFDSLSHFEKMLPANEFSRCSQSYLVNLLHVAEIRPASILVGGYELPLSRMRRKAFLQAVSNRLAGQPV